MYGLSDSEYDEMFDIEMLLDLNMAATKLKMNDPVGAISHCKMVILHTNPYNC